MENLIVTDSQGDQMSVSVARYFRLNGVEYLIFSLNEIDEGGYVKLYITKINGNLATTISDDVEWNLIKDTIKNIIKSNKDNIALPITDLDIRKISNLQISDQKVFKLNDSLLQLLSANKKIEPYIAPVVETNIVEETPATDIPEISDFTNLNNTVAPIDQPISNPVQPEPIVNNEVTQPAENLEQNFDDAFSKPVETLENTTTTSTNDAMSEYSLDYKTLYENEIKEKNELIQENQKYKNIIEQLKTLVNETF